MSCGEVLVREDALLGVARSASGLAWRLRAADERAAAALTQKLGISDILARVLVGRGIGPEDAEGFLRPTLRASLPDPFHLKGMGAAVERLARAVVKGETVGVFGDYDVDGATSSALLARYFRALGVAAHVHIPDRQKEGYGPNIAALGDLRARGCAVIVTVDCGATAHEPLGQAAAEGIEVIVFDHHIGSALLPDALAVVNPNRCDETSPFGYLAAVGVTFLALVALNRVLREAGFFQNAEEPNLLHFLDLVALGTVADVAPLIGLNRAFVRQGLQVLGQRRNAGLAALLDKAGCSGPLSAYHLGFVLGPRVNAGGRVGHAPYGARLLAGEDALENARLAEALDRYNAERKAIEDMVLADALAQAADQLHRPFLMVVGEGWHPGVIGVVAGRLKERFERPAAVLAVEGGVAKASARSVAGVDLGAAIIAAREEGLLLAGGGHAMAAGFNVDQGKIEALHRFLEARLGEGVAAYLAGRHLALDAALAVDALTPELARALDDAAPFGVGNPAPRFAVAGARVLQTAVAGEKHVRVLLASAQGNARLWAVAFRAVGTPLGDALLASRGRLLHAAGQIKLEHWNGHARVGFHLDDAAFAV